jgi:hypothetical protein
METEKVVLVLTDSLGLPRSSPETCRFRETWPERLRNEGYKIRQCSIGGATSSDLANQLNYYGDMPINTCVLQVGIVDCTPRFATKPEIYAIKQLGKSVSGKILIMLNKRIVRKYRGITYVSEHEFKNNLLQINDKCNKTVAVPVVANIENLIKKLQV